MLAAALSLGAASPLPIAAPPPQVPAGSLLQAADASQFSDALRLEGVAGYVEGRAAEAIGRAFSREGAQWLSDAFADAINRAREGGGMLDLEALFRQDEALKARVQAELGRRLKAWLPGQAREVVMRDLLGAAVGERQAAEVNAIAGRVAREMEGTLNDRIDAAAGTLYDAALSRLRQRLSESGVPSWVDPTDLRATIRGALDLDRIGAAAANQLSGIVGEGTAAAIRSRIEDALGGQLPPEAIEALRRGPEAFERYVGQAQRFLPGGGLRGLSESALNRPLVRLPNEAYGAILAGTAAGHYARAFSGVFVDATELRRAVEVTRVMVWQLQHKEAISLTVLQLGSLARDLARSVGLGDSFEGLLSRVREPLQQLQQQADRIDALLRQPLAEVRGQLADAAGEMQRRLSDLQSQLTSPVRDQVDRAQAGLQGIAEDAGDALPIDGLPGDWEEAKRELGLPDRLLGEAGERSVEELLQVRSRLAAVNDRVSEGLADAAATALEGAHLLGPAAEILGVDRVPARHPSAESALDPVLLHSGEYVQQVTELTLPTPGMPVRFQRTYLGRAGFFGELGWRWTHNFAERLLPWNDGTSDGLTHVDEEGRKRFFRAEGGGYRAPAGTDDRLQPVEGGGWLLTGREGLTTRFDARGRPVERRERHGAVIRYEYGRDGLLAAIIDPLGRRLGFERRGDGLVTAMIGPAGRRTSFRYDAQGNLASVTAPAASRSAPQRVTAYRYGSPGSPQAHAILMISDPNGRVWLRNRYDDDGRIVAQRHGGTPWMQVRYAAGEGEVAARAWVTDAAGKTLLYEHDAQGQLLRLWSYDGGRYDLQEARRFDADGAMTERCFDDGSCRRFSYDAPGRLIAAERTTSPDAVPQTTRIAREPLFGRISGIERPDGSAVRIDYDPAGGDPAFLWTRASGDAPWVIAARYEHGPGGELTRVIDAQGAETAFEYAPPSDPDGDGIRLPREAAAAATAKSGWPVRISRKPGGDAPAAVTSLGYDAIGNVQRVRHPDGSEQRFTLNALGRAVLEKGSGRWPVRYSYDANDNLTEVHIEREGAPIVHRLAYGDLDRLVSVDAQVDAGRRAVTRLRYDAEGELVEVVRPEGNVIRLEGGAAVAGFSLLPTLSAATAEVSTGSDGVATRYERDDLGRVTAIRREGGGLSAVERFEWDLNGRLLRAVDANGEAIEYGWDAHDRLILERHPDGTERRLAYDAAGRVVAVQQRDGAVLSIVRDAAGRMTSREGRRGEEVLRQRFAYDAAGRLAMAVDEGDPADPEDDALSRFVYDRQSRPIAEAAGERWITRAFDSAGRVVSRAVGGGAPLHLLRDASGRTQALLRGAERIAAFLRGPGGELQRAATAGAELSIERDGSGRVRRRAYSSNGRTLAEWSYERDAAGRVSAERDSLRGATLQAQRDGLGRLIAFGSERFAYDLAGNLLNAEAEEGGWRVALDPLGRPSAIWRGNEVMARYRYDAFDRRVREDFADVERALLWEGGRLIAEYASDAAPVEHFYDEDAGLGPPVVSRREGVLMTPVADRIGSVRGLAEPGGRIRERCDYAAYGREISCRDVAFAFGFAGQRRSADGRTLDLRHRAYDPWQGRFLSPDPLGIRMPLRARAVAAIVPPPSYHRGQGHASSATFPHRVDAAGAPRFGLLALAAALPHPELNLTAYAQGDPLTYADPMGLASILFERVANQMTIYDGEGVEVSRYEAGNNVVRPEADPLQVGGRGPFPDGTFSVGVPEFYDEAYRDEIYERFGFEQPVEGESVVSGAGWAGGREGAYNTSQGLIRLRVGAATEGVDLAAWERGLFIHGGRRNRASARTMGCIRARDDELETFAANLIQLRRQGDPVTVLTVR